LQLLRNAGRPLLLLLLLLLVRKKLQL